MADGNAQTINIDRYWQLEGKIDSDRSREDASEELFHLIEDSVKLRMISDVPLGAFLSGGLGMYFESQAQSSLLDFEKQPSYQKLSELDDYQNYRDISYYTAAAIATSALVLWFWPEAEDNNISIIPSPQSLTLTGRF